MANPRLPAIAKDPVIGVELRLSQSFIVDLGNQAAQGVFIVPYGLKCYIEQIDIHDPQSPVGTAANGSLTLSAGWAASSTNVLNPASPNVLGASGTATFSAGQCVNLYNGAPATPPTSGAIGYALGIGGQTFNIQFTWGGSAPAVGTYVKIGVMGHLSVS